MASRYIGPVNSMTYVRARCVHYVSPSRLSRFTTRAISLARNLEHLMYDIKTKFAATFLISCALLSGACDSDLAPEVVHNAAAVTQAEFSLGEAISEMELADEANVAVDELHISPIDGAVQLRMGELPDGTFGVTEGAGGRAIAPGVWEVETEEGVIQQVIMGVEGQEWLIEQLTAELDGLRGQRNEPGHEDALLEQIAAVEAAIASAKGSLYDLTQSGGVQAPSCNISLYTGPSGPVSGIPGAAAFAQSSCSGGCATITVRSQACCNGACTPISIATNTVCAPLWTAGVIRSGSGSGWAQVFVAPVVVTNQGFSCY
jgi:hypothetical protein